MRHLGPIAGIASSGRYIATAGYDNRILLWHAGNREALARANHDHLVNHCAFSHDGRWLVSSSSDYSARVWSVPTLRLQAVLPGHGDDVDMAVFSPDDSRIATCALDRCVRIFDLEGRCLHTLRGHTGNVLSLSWTKDGRYVVSSSVDGTLRTWDAVGGAAWETTDLQVRTDSVAVDAQGVIYAGDDRGRIAIVQNGCVRFVRAHGAGVKKVALNARQDSLVSLSYDRTLCVWNIGGQRDLEERIRTTLPETIWARAATFLEDGRIATGTFGSTYALFDPISAQWDVQGVAAGEAINAVLNVAGNIYSVGDAGQVRIDGEPAAEMGSLCNFLVAAGDRVFTGGQMGKLFDAHTGRVLYTHHSPLNCGAAWDHNGAPQLAVGTYTGEILILEPDSHRGGMNLVAELKVYENAVKSLCGSDGLLFSVCASTDIAWHRISDWSLVKRVDKAHDRIANAGCALGNRRFASVGRDRTLRLWDAGQVQVFPSPHPNSVKCLGVDDAHTALLTGSYGGTLALFDLVHLRWTSLHRPTTAGISSIAWDDARQRFLAASYNGTIYPVAA